MATKAKALTTELEAVESRVSAIGTAMGVAWQELRFLFGHLSPPTNQKGLERAQLLLTEYRINLGKLQTLQLWQQVALAQSNAAKKVRVGPHLPWVQYGIMVGSTYRNPATKETFTKRNSGTVPLWMRQAIAEGQNPEQFLVKQK